MKKTKKMLSGLLAVSMLISMLACFALPASAADEQTVYYISSKTQWDNICDKVNASSDGFAGKTIYVMTDISFGGKWSNHMDAFAGTLDGNGHKFTNITATTKATGTSSNPVFHPAGLVENLSGTIQNLTIDSTCTFADIEVKSSHSSVYKAHLGAFASVSEGGTIKNCAFLGSYDATPNSYSTDRCLGGFIGRAKSGTTTIEGCAFGGTLTGHASQGSGTAAFVGMKNSTATVKLGYSVAKGTVTGLNPGMVCASATIKKSYALGGLNAYVGSSSADYEMSADQIKEAVWKANEDRTDGGYISVDASDALYIGSANDRVVKGTTVDGTTTVDYYAPRSGSKASTQTSFTPATVSGKTPVVSGAEYIDGIVYVDHSDFTIEYVDEAVKLRSDLQAMVNAYNAMDQKRFSTWSNVTTWLTAAQSVLDNASATATQLQEQITAEASVDAGYSRPGTSKYPSVSEYNTYKYVDNITDYKVDGKADWVAAVEMSNYVENPNAVNFKGLKLHIVSDIDMGGEKMAPLCYGYIFDGSLDGRDHVFKNINIEIDNPYGPVALIGVAGATKTSTIQRVGIESGTITVTGMPRYKTSKTEITATENIVAGIVGKTYKAGCKVLKCWNNTSIDAENVYEAAGIVGDSRNGTIVDTCLNLGSTEMYGIIGYGASKATIYNSVSCGTPDGLATYAPTTTIDTYVKNSKGAVTALSFGGSPDSDQKAALKTFNNNNTTMNVAEAAWSVNANYTLRDGEDTRQYYTLNENGEVRFGTAAKQIYRVKLVCYEHEANCSTHPVSYTYAGTDEWTAVDFDFDANYYASADEKVTIKGNSIQFADGVTPVGTSTAEDRMTFEVKVGHNADRGNVNGSSDGKINVLDALSAVQMVAGKKAKNVLTADLNNNLDVDINDAYQVVRYVFGNKEKVTFLPGKMENRKDDYLKVVSYNIKSFHYDPTASSNNGTPMCRLDDVMSEIRALNASDDPLDVIGFQEIDRYNKDAWANYNSSASSVPVNETVDQLQLLAEEMNIPYDEEHAIFTITIPNTSLREDGGYGNGIISRYPFAKDTDGTVKQGVSYDMVFFADKCWNGDESQGIDGTEARGFTWAKIDVNENGQYDVESDFIFVNFHFMNASNRQVAYMLEYMKTNFPGSRIVCVGDVNKAPYNMDRSFDRGSFTALNGGKNFDTYTITNAHSGSLVDNIFVSNNVEYYKPSDSATGLYNRIVYYNTSTGKIDPTATSVNKSGGIWSASDHSPIYAYVKIK